MPLWIRALSWLPLPLLYALMGSLAWLVRYVLRHRVSQVRANLSACFPELDRERIEGILNASYRNLAQVAAEFIKMARLSAEQLRDRVRTSHFEPVLAQIAAGHSVLLLSSHQCNWEWALQGTALNLPVPISAAYKPLHSDRADAQLRRLRARFGVHLVAAKRLAREVIRHRRELRAVGIMADQMPSSSGGRHWLTFLGRDTAFYPGPAEIARMTGFAAYFIAMRRIRRGHYELEAQAIAGADEQLEPQTFTARYAERIEQQIRRDPSNWMWLHRRWKFARTEALVTDPSSQQ